MNKFKAGDFTSGKMGEIYKSVAKNGRCAISHKQHGEMYLVSKDALDNSISNLIETFTGFSVTLGGGASVEYQGQSIAGNMGEDLAEALASSAFDSWMGNKDTDAIEFMSIFMTSYCEAAFSCADEDLVIRKSKRYVSNGDD